MTNTMNSVYTAKKATVHGRIVSAHAKDGKTVIALQTADQGVVYAKVNGDSEKRLAYLTAGKVIALEQYGMTELTSEHERHVVVHCNRITF